MSEVLHVIASNVVPGHGPAQHIIDLKDLGGGIVVLSIEAILNPNKTETVECKSVSEAADELERRGFVDQAKELRAKAPAATAEEPAKAEQPVGAPPEEPNPETEVARPEDDAPAQQSGSASLDASAVIAGAPEETGDEHDDFAAQTRTSDGGG